MTLGTGQQKTISEIVSSLEQLDISYHITHHNYRDDVHNTKNVIWNTACISSHNVKQGSFFIGLQGEVQNGGLFVHQALLQGAVLVLVEKGYENHIIHNELSHTFSVIVVENTLSTLSRMASMIRQALSPHCTFIGVTGSAGKTSTKHIIYRLLDSYKEARCSQGNLNTVQGMSLCILNMDWEAVEFAVFECGISGAGEMSALVDILDPDYAVITNVGNAHIGEYENRDALMYEKLTIAKHISKDGMLWIPDDDIQLQKTAGEMALSCEIALHGKANDMYISHSDKGIEGIVLHCDNKGHDEDMPVPLLGEVNVYNALLGLQVAMYLGVSFDACKIALSNIQGIEGRYQVLHTAPLLINDSYNASPEAVKYAVQWFSLITNYQMKIVLLGGMRELGKDEFALHNTLIESIADVSVQHIILYGEEFDNVPIPKDMKEQHIIKIKHKADIMPLLKKLTKDISLEQIAILLKGSRFYTLETIAEEYIRYLETKMHRS